MVRQDQLKPPQGARRKRKRVGRGDASRHGTYSTKGMKGQKSRSGGGVRPGFEGGQLPIIRRLSKMRGFTNIFKTEYVVVNITRLSQFPKGSQVTPLSLYEAGIIKNLKVQVKILGLGEIDKPLSVSAHKFSKSARQKIESAGGQVSGIG